MLQIDAVMCTTGGSDRLQDNRSRWTARSAIALSPPRISPWVTQSVLSNASTAGAPGLEATWPRRSIHRPPPPPSSYSLREPSRSPRIPLALGVVHQCRLMSVFSSSVPSSTRVAPDRMLRSAARLPSPNPPSPSHATSKPTAPPTAGAAAATTAPSSPSKKAEPAQGHEDNTALLARERNHRADDAFALTLFKRLGPTARARALAVRIRQGDPLIQLLGRS